MKLDQNPISSYSIDQYNVKQAGDKTNENHQLRNIVQTYYQILETDIKKNTWTPVRRVDILSLI